MPESKIFHLPESDAVQQIVDTVRHADSGVAPFALVLGSGFSYGLVPTARELVEESLPLWMKSLEERRPFSELAAAPLEERLSTARGFWAQFTGRNRNRGLDLPLDPHTGLPKEYSAAYKSAFDPHLSGAVGETAQARRFQRALMRLDQPRLNAAHFLLASLLGAQPGHSRESGLFKTQAAFCRLILTTNFDPFLQIALQSVNRLYFMSDTPELGVGDEIFDDQTDAIHIVYLHGSIHRRSQAATDAEIKALKEKNARTLAPVLKRRGVIVLGYSGWDDAVVEALAACDRFDHLLYWCGREPDPMAPGAFGERVPGILRNPTAFYVQVHGAGRFINQLHRHLVGRLPRLIGSPIALLREMLGTIDLTELETLASPAQQGAIGPQPQSAKEALVALHKAVIERLARVEELFNSESVSSDLLVWARAAAALGDYSQSIELFTQVLDLASLPVRDRAEALVERGLAYYFSGQHESAQSDWTSVIELPDSPVEQVAQALFNRGATWDEKGDSRKALADYTHVIERLPGAPVEHVATALFNRGVTWDEQGDGEKALADYTYVIERLPGAPVEQMATALVNRGVLWGQKGDSEKALADYTYVVERLPGAPIEQVAQALFNRGATWDEQGDREKALADYTRVIEQLPGAPVEHVAMALVNRGAAWDEKGQREKALTDYTHVIERLPGAPVEQTAQALVSRGATWDEKGDSEKALADYTRVIERLAGAPAEQAAQALVNRGVTWGEKGESEKALADYTSVIERLPGAPVEEVAKALANRGWQFYRAKMFDAFARDTEAALAKDPALDSAAFNLGLALLACGRDAEALAAYERAAQQFPDRIQDLGLPDLAEAEREWLAKERARPVYSLLESRRS